MSELTEAEILDCLRTNLALAAEGADNLAAGVRGPVYVSFREHMRLAEGACRQMAAWRGDSRWLPFGMKVNEALQRCGNWLRSRDPAWRFAGLAEILRVALAQAHDLETKATGRIGVILPDVLPAPIRTEGRPVAVPAAYKKIRPTLLDARGKPISGTVH